MNWSTVFKRRPTPAFVLSCLALFVSLGGVSYGVATGSINSREIKNNTVRSKDLRNNDVRSRDIRNNTILGRDIRRGTIRASDVGADSLTGTQIVESSLGEVPRAGFAQNAFRAFSSANVDTLKTVGSHKRATSSASDNDPAVARGAASEVPLFTFGPFTVYGKCFNDADGDLTFAETYIRSSVAGAIADGEGGDSVDGSPEFLDQADEDERQLNTTSAANDASTINADDDLAFGAAAPDGSGITGEIGVASKNGSLPGGNGIYGDGDVCLFFGHVAG